MPSLTNNTTPFTGVISFNVVSAESTGSTHVTVTFSHPPDPAQAGILSNYSIPGLMLSGGFADLIGDTVTMTTSAQSSAQYTVTVSNVTRAADGQAMTTTATTFPGAGTFNIVSAEAISNTMVRVTFDAPPDPFGLSMIDSLDIPGLTINEVTAIENDVLLTTSTQTAIVYTVTANINIFRASDGLQLTTNSATFTGIEAFNIVSAVATGAYQFAVTFDAPPTAGHATDIANYSVAGLTLSGAGTLVGNVVTLQTKAAQSTETYTALVSGKVLRASDAATLTTKSAAFTGRTTFGVASVASTGTVHCAVTFSHPPDGTQAVDLNNYTVSHGLVLSAPVLNGSVVTFVTSAQSAVVYQIQVNGITRASDTEPLTAQIKAFTGTTEVFA